MTPDCLNVVMISFGMLGLALPPGAAAVAVVAVVVVVVAVVVAAAVDEVGVDEAVVAAFAAVAGGSVPECEFLVVEVIGEVEVAAVLVEAAGVEFDLSAVAASLAIVVAAN